MIYQISNLIKDEFINNLAIAFAPLKYNGGIFKRIYNKSDFNYITIEDIYGNAINIIKDTFDLKLFLESIYRSELMGVRSKTFKKLIIKVFEEFANHKDNKYHLIVTIDYPYRDFIRMIVYIDDGVVKFSIQKNNVMISLKTRKLDNLYQKAGANSFIIRYRLLSENSYKVSKPVSIIELNVEYNAYTLNKKLYENPKIIIDNKSSHLLRINHFNKLNNLISDAQIFDSNYSDAIYAQFVKLLVDEVDRLFKDKHNVNYVHNFTNEIIDGYDETLNKFIIDNAHAYKYRAENQLSFKNVVYQHTSGNISKFYCVDISGESFSQNNSVYKITLLEIDDDTITLDVFNDYVESYYQKYKEYPSYYDMMDFINYMITEMKIDCNKVHYYHSPLLYEDTDEEIKKWREMVYDIDDNENNNLFWRDDYSKMDNVVDEEYIYKNLDEKKKE